MPFEVFGPITATSTGLTTATTAYTDGDTLGDELSFDTNYDSGFITTAILTDESNIIGGVDLLLYDRTVTAAADNAAHSISDADRLFALPPIHFPFPVADANGRTAAIDSIMIQFSANTAQTLCGILVTRSGHTFFSSGGADSLQVKLYGLGYVAP